MSRSVLRRALSLLLSFLLILSIFPVFELSAHAASTDYNFVVSSNIPFADSKDSCSNPYLIFKQGTSVSDLEIQDLEKMSDSSFRYSDIDSTGLYWIQIYNNLDFEGVYLSKVTINDVVIEIPEICTLNNHSFLVIENEIGGIDSRDSIYTRNFDYSDTPISSVRGYLLAFSQIVPSTDININFEFESVEAKFRPEFLIAPGDEEKARIKNIKWAGDTETGSLYEVTTELITSPYNPHLGNYDLDYYTLNSDNSRYDISLTSENYIESFQHESLKGYWKYDEETLSDYWVTDINGDDEIDADISHYYISFTYFATSDDEVALHYCPGYLTLSLICYRADTIPVGEWIGLTALPDINDYYNVLAENSIPLIEGMDGYFRIIITAHGLCYSDKPSDYSLKLYNGNINDGQLLVSYYGANSALKARPFAAVPAVGCIAFTALKLPAINKVSIDLEWHGFKLFTTNDVISAEDIPQVQEFMSYYQTTYGMDKFGRTAYTEAEKASDAYRLYEQYSPYRYVLRTVYSEQMKAISMAGEGNYNAALVSAKAALDSAARGEGCDTATWTFINNPDKGTTSRPIIAAMPKNRSYCASDAIEAALESEWPGKWTYTYTNSQFGAFVTNITAGGEEDVGTFALSTHYGSYGFWYINGVSSNWGVSNYDIQDGDVMAWGNPDPDFTWVWAILRWKLGDAEIERVLSQKGISYESSEFNALEADGLAALFPADNYPDVDWCTRGDGQFSRYGQLRELEAQEATIRLINAIGDVSPQSGDAIAAARTSYDALEAKTQALVSNYDVLLAAEAAYSELTKITDADTVREAVMASLAADPTAIKVGSVNGEWKIFALARDGRIDANSEISKNYLRLLNSALARDDGTIESLTDYERVTFALSSLGIDAASFRYDEDSRDYDLIGPYATYDENMLLNQKLFGLLALNAKPYTENTEAFVNGLIEDKLPTGGWNITGVGSADADMTAEVITALAPYYQTNPTVQAAIDEAIEVLHEIQDTTAGGFSTMGQYNSCSIAQVIVALCSLGIDPADEAWTVNTLYNPITALCQFFDEDTGMIKFTLNASKSDQMSTEQAAYALAAYARLQAEKPILYDMADAFDLTYENKLSLAELKTTLEGMTWDLAQENAGDDAAVKAAVEALLTEDLLAGATAEVTVTNFEPATAGTEEAPAGTNGSYTAAIALSKGEGEAQAMETVTVTGAITATEYVEPETYTFIMKSNLPYGTVRTSTTNPFPIMKYATTAQTLVVVDDYTRQYPGVIESNGIYYVQIYNNLDLADYYLSKVTINGTEIEIPEASSTNDEMSHEITAEIDGIENRGYIRVRNWDYTRDRTSTSNRGYAISFGQLEVSKDVEVCFEFTEITTDPSAENAAALAELKTTLEGMTWDLAQENAGDDAAVKAAVEALLTEDLLAGATAEVTVTNFEPATAGTEEAPAGTNGSYTAAIALSKGEGEAQAMETVTVTGAITATEYTEPETFTFIMKSNLPYGSVRTSTTNPFPIMKYATTAQTLVVVDEYTRQYPGVIESNGIYYVQIYNNLDLTDYYLSKVTINGTEIEIPEASSTNDEMSHEITAEIDGIENRGYIRVRNWDYTRDRTSTSNRGYAISFGQLEVSKNVEVCFEFTEVATDPSAENAAALAALKTTLEGMIWDLAQADAGDEAAVKTAVETLLTEELLAGAAAEVTVTSFEAATEGTAEATAGTNGSYTATIALCKGEGEAQATATVTVTSTITATEYAIPEGKVLVKFRLIGSYPSTQNVDMGVSDYRPDYVTWIPTKTYLVNTDSTMYDLFMMAMDEAGLRSTGADDGYVKAIFAPEILTGYKLSESTNGYRCGWMYTVNGVHVGVGLDGYVFSDDESVMANRTANVVWHYVNDYLYEVSDWRDDSGNVASLGNASIWDKWIDAEDVEPSAVPVSSISLDLSAASVDVGGTVQLVATVLPSYAYDKTVTWSSSDTSIATVDGGTVTGVKAGTATITAKSGDKTATCTVTVKTIPVEGIALDQSEAIIEVNSTVPLTATVSPENATDKTVTWSSSDESVATVVDGVVTGVKAGTATITANAGGKTATCVVTVKDAVIAVTKVTLDKTEASVEVDGMITLTATVSPTNATDKTVTWSSSDKNIATVKDGKVTGVKAGTVTITVKAGEKTATCLVTVTEKAPEEVPVEKIKISEADGTPVATVTSSVKNSVATLHVEADRPCIVVVKVGDTYERLEAKKNGDGYDFSVSGYSTDMEFYVLLKGDVNGDGIVDGSDVTKAKAAYLGKTTLDELGTMAADINGDGLDGSDITKMKAAYLGKTTLDW